VSAGFHFTKVMCRLCKNFTSRLDALKHIDVDRVAVSFSQTRSSARAGIYATLTPLRFDGGKSHSVRRGRKWGMQKVLDEKGREMLYILTFYLPRFLDLPFREKMATIMHELWHISPRFDGDMRRFPGRNFAHGSSKKKYDDAMEKLVDEWFALSPPKELYDFLQLNYRELVERYGKVVGSKYPAPKLFSID